MPIYEQASVSYQLGPDGWAYLAAINQVESDFDQSALPGVHSATNQYGAAGPMQIGIGGSAGDTWAGYQVQVPDGPTPPSVYDETDAVYAAANYLHAQGAPSNWPAAIYAYNHAGWYVEQVTNLAQRYASNDNDNDNETAEEADDISVCAQPAATTPGTTAQILPNGTALAPADAPLQVQDVIAAGNRIIDTFYSQERRPNMLTHIQDSYDCSGSVDFVLYNAGLSSPQARHRRRRRRRLQRPRDLRPRRARHVDHPVRLGRACVH